jgi:hypothetical protein
VGTGNGSPWDRDWRSPDGSDNFYLSSIVALRPDTGAFVWYFQEVPGDQCDYTVTQGIILADLRIDGKLRKVILHTPKCGFFYVIDRKTGKFLSGVPYVNITWATGIDQKTGRPIEAANARYDVKGVMLAPGPGGAHSWQAMSFNPDTGLVYIPGQNSTFFYAEDPDFKYELGSYNWGINYKFPGGGRNPGTQPPPPPRPNPAAPPANRTAGEPPPPRYGGFLLAWDPVAQKER